MGWLQVRALLSSRDVATLYASALRELEARVALTMRTAAKLRSLYALKLGVPMTSSR